MSKRLYCDRHRANHVKRCPRCLEEDFRKSVQLVLKAGLSTGHAETSVELTQELLDQFKELKIARMGTMSDIVERLRNDDFPGEYVREAADEIESLRGELRSRNSRIEKLEHANKLTLRAWDRQVIGMQNRIQELEEENLDLSNQLYEWEEGIYD